MKTGNLYFVRRSDGLIKIGYTGDFNRRIAALTKSHGPLEIIRVINGDRKREKRLHGEFARFNEFGEWFRGDPALLSLITSLADGDAASISTSAIEREWTRGDQQMADEARRVVMRLIEVRRQRTGLKNNAAMAALCADHRLRLWTVRNLQAGRRTTVTAFAYRRLREALVAELTSHCAELSADLTSEAVR